MKGRPAAWTGNLWLLAGGLALLAATLALGPDGFVAAVGFVYVHALPQFAPVFRDDLAGETRTLYPLLAGLGGAAVATYAILGRRRVDLAAWLLAGDWRAPGAWRALALLAVIAYGGLFAGVRVAREVRRARWLAGTSFEERKLRLWGLATGEPDYRPVAAFQAAASGRGSLAILRSRPGRFRSIFYASYLFPIRVYDIRSESCSDADVTALRAAQPPVGWVQRSCEAGAPFAPRALASGPR